MSEYCRKNLFRITGGARSFGHWHYTYLYYSQVVYREGEKNRKHWEDFRDKLYARIVGQQNGEDGGFDQSTDMHGRALRTGSRAQSRGG